MPTTFEFDNCREEEGTASATGPRRFLRRYECFASDIATVPEVGTAIGTQEGIFIGTPHPDWPDAYCEEITPRRDGENHLQWVVECVFVEPTPMPGTVPGMPGGGSTGTAPGSGSGSPFQSPAPWDRPTFFSTDFRKEPRFRRKDRDGKFLVNTAMDSLEDVPPQYEPIGILKATKFYQSWSFDLGMALIGRTNQDTWQGYDPDTWLIEACPASPQTQGPWTFWKVDYTISYNPDGWNPTRILNLGRRTSKLVTPPAPAPQYREFTTILDKYTMSPAGPSFLNLAGDGVLALGPGVDPIELEFRFNDRVNFNGLIDP